VVGTVRSGAAALATARVAGHLAGRTSVSGPDRAGFIVGALVHPYLNDAVKMLESAYAAVDDIDAAMTLGCAYPQGPFEQLDDLGPAAVLVAQRRIYAETRQPGLAPAPLLEHMVTAGRHFRGPGG
jgi:3-hydroxybutyryl-CoA dehydrogenase